MCLVIFFGKYLVMSIKLIIFAAITHNNQRYGKDKVKDKRTPAGA